MSKKKYKRKRRLVRNAGATATVSMSMVLFLVGLLALILFLTRDMSRELRENLTLSVVIKDEATAQQISGIKEFIEKSPFAKSAQYITKEQALQDHVDALGEDPAEFLGWNPLFASLEVKLNASYAHPDSVAKIEQQLSRYENIHKVVYQRDMIAMVNENIRKISYILVGLTSILMLISFALINNTVRLRTYSNRFIINTMKLVGAKSWFIRKPYIKQSIFSGVIAAVLAMLLLSGLVFYMKYKFGLETVFITKETALVIAGIVLISGIILTAISSYFAVGKYIRMCTDDMYFA
ncbi:MAG: cell division protein FtsX [Bacteroidales bacterium]|nr:cell division protein FtsX [Bacteroidales bacterium]